MEEGDIAGNGAAGNGFDLPQLRAMDTLYGDLRDAMLDRLKAMPKPWTVMSEREQTELIEGISRAARHLITQACRMVAAQGFSAITCAIEKATIKDGLVLQIKASKHDPLRHELIDAAVENAPAMIVLASAEQYMGEEKPARPDPDEPPLPGTGDELADKVVTTALRGRRRRRKPTEDQPQA